jgi:hypothetical protein
MKSIVLITTCIVAALMFQTSRAILPAAGVIAPVVPGIMPPMFGALPFFGGLGFGLGFPFLGALGFGRLAMLGLLGRKKRDLTPITPVQPSPIRCVIATSNKTIECSLGVERRIGCQFEPRLSEMSKIKVNLVDLALLDHVDGSVEFLNLVSTKTSSKLAAFLAKAGAATGTFTFIHPSTLEPHLLAVYDDANLGVPGFLVKDPACFNSLVGIAKSAGGNVRVNLLIE